MGEDKTNDPGIDEEKCRLQKQREERMDQRRITAMCGTEWRSKSRIHSKGRALKTISPRNIRCLDNEVKSIERRDRIKRIGNLADKADVAARTDNSEDLYQVQKKLLCNMKARGCPVKQ